MITSTFVGFPWVLTSGRYHPGVHASESVTLLAEQLAQVPFFSDLDPGLVRELARSAVRRTFVTGEIAFLEGEPSPGLLVIESGRIKVVKSSPQGREHVLEVLAPWQPANAVAVFTQRPSPATAIALEPVQAWLLPRDAVTRLLREHPAFAERVIESMAAHLIRLTELVASLSLRSVIERLARLILEEAVDGRVERPRWYTLPELAARLGTVPDVAQRALGRLAADGLVEVSRREILIKDRGALERRTG